MDFLPSSRQLSTGSFEAVAVDLVTGVSIPDARFEHRSTGDPRHGIAAELRPETRELLQAIKGATPAIRRLALNSAPFGLRSELMAYGLSEDCTPAGGGLRLTTLGESVLEAIAPLGEEEREQLAQRAEQALGDPDAR